jgi:hypothetical protein
MTSPATPPTLPPPARALNRIRLTGWMLVLFGLCAAGMLVLVDGTLRQRAELRAQLSRDGVAIVPGDVWARTPARAGMDTRVIAYRFTPPGGSEVEGADPIPAADLAAVLGEGRPQVLYLPDRPQINALAVTVAAAEAAGGVAALRRGFAFWMLSGVAAALMALGAALILRRPAAG